MYVRNYRHKVIEKVSNGMSLVVGELVIAGIDKSKGTNYHRAKVMAANEVCQVNCAKVQKKHQKFNRKKTFEKCIILGSSN